MTLVFGTTRRFQLAMAAVALASIAACASSRPFDSAPATQSESSHACVARPGQVAVFEDADFGGRCSAVSVGEYVFPEALGVENDSVSSLRIGEGVRALACRDRAFGGECTYFDESITPLDPTAIGNDTLSSLRVEPRPDGCTPGSRQIAVFSERNYSGSCQVLGIGDFSNSQDLQLRNDAISSVRVGPGAQALLCRDDGFGEPCERVTADLADLGSTSVGDDNVSSVRVLRSGSDCIARGATDRIAPYVGAIEAYCTRAYPRILRILATSPIFSPPLVISFTSLEVHTGEARGRDVYVNEARWNPDDLGMFDHELTHLVEMYPDAPGWLSEGIADFVRAELGGAAVWNDYHCRGDETYASGYGCAAAMLRFVDVANPGAVRALHGRLRTSAFDGRIAGRDVDSVWAECLRSGACMPR